jgi:hypothetical protein
MIGIGSKERRFCFSMPSSSSFVCFAFSLSLCVASEGKEGCSILGGEGNVEEGCLHALFEESFFLFARVNLFHFFYFYFIFDFFFIFYFLFCVFGFRCVFVISGRRACRSTSNVKQRCQSCNFLFEFRIFFEQGSRAGFFDVKGDVEAPDFRVCCVCVCFYIGELWGWH